MSEPNASAEKWSENVAALAVDALFNAGLVRRDEFDEAKTIVEEEIFVRLCCNDFPPSADDTKMAGDSDTSG